MRSVYFIVIFFFLNKTYLFAQLPNQFKIGNYLELSQNDTLKVFFNCTGTIHDKSCSDFYRVGKRDMGIINFTGEIVDYYVSTQSAAFKAKIANNNLEGYAFYYYQNGIIKEEGNYISNVRQGKWTFYYPDGKPKLILYYNSSETEPEILSAFTDKGMETVIDGEGNLSLEFSGLKQCTPFIGSGPVKNGKKDGKWSFNNIDATSSIAEEHYKEGKFIKGISTYGQTQYQDPKIKFTKFYPNENLSLTENYEGCPGDKLRLLEYNDNGLSQSFYPELQKKLDKFDKKATDQWLITGITINSDDKVSEVNVSSSINDTILENYIYEILLKQDKWTAMVLNSKKTISYVYFAVLVSENKCYIIPYYLITH